MPLCLWGVQTRLDETEMPARLGRCSHVYKCNILTRNYQVSIRRHARRSGTAAGMVGSVSTAGQGSGVVLSISRCGSEGTDAGRWTDAAGLVPLVLWFTMLEYEIQLLVGTVFSEKRDKDRVLPKAIIL